MTEPAEQPAPRRVRIDPETCASTGRCAYALPHVFALSEQGVGEVLDPNPPARYAAQLAEVADLCPSRAIHLDPDESEA